MAEPSDEEDVEVEDRRLAGLLLSGNWSQPEEAPATEDGLEDGGTEKSKSQPPLSPTPAAFLVEEADALGRSKSHEGDVVVVFLVVVKEGVSRSKSHPPPTEVSACEAPDVSVPPKKNGSGRPQQAQSGR